LKYQRVQAANLSKSARRGAKVERSTSQDALNVDTALEPKGRRFENELCTPSLT
jgi:hypothetical protein